MSIGFLKFNHPSSEKLGYLVGFVIALICIALQKKGGFEVRNNKIDTCLNNARWRGGQVQHNVHVWLSSVHNYITFKYSCLATVVHILL